MNLFMKRLLFLCFVINIIGILYIFFYPLLSIVLFNQTNQEMTAFYFESDLGAFIMYFFAIIGMILWIKSLLFFFKYDKSPVRIVLLLCLNFLYTPFYYWKIMQKSVNYGF